MNFNKAKEFAGQQILPDNFSTSTFGREARFGIINISDAPKPSMFPRF